MEGVGELGPGKADWGLPLGIPPHPPAVIVPEGKALDPGLPGGGDADRAGLWKCR